MDQELQALGERVDRILTLARRLADENATLREQLATARNDNERLQQRIDEARARVETALSRLPAALLGEDDDPRSPNGSAGAGDTGASNATAASTASANESSAP
ncbi:MAG: hypothetical protein GX644_13605 [Limnobacter sp.]|nr:hypothetical protein [Limnobacter sp.]